MILQAQEIAKKLYYTIEWLLNQSRNKCSQYIIYIKNYEESISYISFNYPLETDQESGLYMP
jgi:hypothetical protein